MTKKFLSQVKSALTALPVKYFKESDTPAIANKI